ncbi:MAG: hypothetical protein ISS66_14130 [Desulfobacteraceae bacterium]|nr:hypothetical protein [Desulfobacteraceae bacterium]
MLRTIALKQPKATPRGFQYAYMLLEFQKTVKQMAAKPIVDYFQRVCDAKIMHGSNLAMVRCCEGIEALAGKV